MQFLRAANFIDPKWNLMKEIACMRIVGGSSVVVIKGRGNWKALLSEDVRTPADLEAVNQMVALPGTVQCVVPLFNDMWVAKVPRLSPSWPFISGSAR